MPRTRKKVIKTIYKDEDRSDAEEMQDFSDSGSEAHISEESESDDEIVSDVSSSSEFTKATQKRNTKKAAPRKPAQIKNVTVKKSKFAQTFINKIRPKPMSNDDEIEESVKKFSVKEMTAADKLLPSVLNLSESDSSDEEGPSTSKKMVAVVKNINKDKDSERANENKSDDERISEYNDMWSKNLQPENSEEVAKKTFMELEKHKLRIEEAKASVQQYSGTNVSRNDSSMEVDVNDLLAQGEEAPATPKITKKSAKKKNKKESDSEIEDWEEVNELKAVPKQGLQLFVEFPDQGCKKSKKLDLEMMMRRKINRVKKEYQVYMHKVHVLAWIGHGNYVSRVLNDQELMAAALSLVPSKDCYPGERVDMKFLEQITTWFKGKLTFKQDKNENKFKPKAPPLKEILLSQIKNKVVTTKKYLVFIFISILRAMGLQCRVMFNFVTLPLKPSQAELCSLSTKKDTKTSDETIVKKEDIKTENKCNAKPKCTKGKSKSIKQLDGTWDSSTDDEFENIMQLDGNDDTVVKTRRAKAKAKADSAKKDDEDVSPPKRAKTTSTSSSKDKESNVVPVKRKRAPKQVESTTEIPKTVASKTTKSPVKRSSPSPRKTRNNVDKEKKNSAIKPNTALKGKGSSDKLDLSDDKVKTKPENKKKPETKIKKDQPKKDSKVEKANAKLPQIVVTNDEGKDEVSSVYFDTSNKFSEAPKRLSLSRKRSQTATPLEVEKKREPKSKDENKAKSRTRSAPGTSAETSKYFESNDKTSELIKSLRTRVSKQDWLEDKQRVSHRDLIAKSKSKNDVKEDLINIIKKRVGEAKTESKRGIVKGKAKPGSGEDSDFLPEEEGSPKHQSDSDGDFKPSKISPKPRSLAKRKLDRRVLSSDDEQSKNKIDVWCEVFVEELEQWISVDVVKARVHCTNEIYAGATHPVCYVVGWDNSNHLKDLTRRYVPHWNTVTRRQRAAPGWLDEALAAGRAPDTPRGREEDAALDRLQLEAPLPASIAEYKNHPLYALQRHLLKFEAIYPPDVATLGFIRGEAVYPRDSIYVCRSRDTWLKEAKSVKLGEKPYKVVKARPKWDKLSNRCITDLPLEVFGPWQVADYEPPTAQGGVVPRNAYGNVELFKECMLPKGTVHMKLPGLNKVAKKLNIDCAPAMTGFDFNGGFTHPVYEGVVVCQEFQEILEQAWELDQEDQLRKENEKLEARVYGNWKRLIKGLLIRERLKDKYGFKEPPAAKPARKRPAAPRLVVKKGA